MKMIVRSIAARRAADPLGRDRARTCARTMRAEEPRLDTSRGQPDGE